MVWSELQQHRGQQKLLRNGYIHRRILSEGSSVFIGKKGKIMPTSSSHKLLCTELRNISDGVAANLSSLEALCKNVCHSRQGRIISPTPVHREEIPDHPQAYCTTTNGGLFLVYDSSVWDEERTHCSFWQIPNIGILMVCSRYLWKFSSNCILNMVNVTKEFFRLCSHFCQIKMKTLAIDYFNSYSNS